VQLTVTNDSLMTGNTSKELPHLTWKTAAKLQFVHDLSTLLINAGQQPVMKAMRN